jgi:hypothetical protein
MEISVIGKTCPHMASLEKVAVANGAKVGALFPWISLRLLTLLIRNSGLCRLQKPETSRSKAPNTFLVSQIPTLMVSRSAIAFCPWTYSTPPLPFNSSLPGSQPLRKIMKTEMGDCKNTVSGETT